MNYLYCRECDHVVDVVFSQEGVPQTRQSVLDFRGILEFVGRQLVTSSMIFSEPSTQRKQRACLVADVFSCGVATKLR